MEEFLIVNNWQDTNSKQMAILSNGGLVASLAGLQRFMFCEVIVHTNNMILIVNKWKYPFSKQLAGY